MAAPQPVDAQQLAQQYASVLNPTPALPGATPAMPDAIPLPNGVDPGYNMTLPPEFLNARFSAKANGSPVPQIDDLTASLRAGQQARADIFNQTGQPAPQ
jgi:hypothetical protein